MFYEIYNSKAQIAARTHSALVNTQRALLTLWHSSDPSTLVDFSTPITYFDRLRIRNPGPSTYTLGPHIDGGSVERWEPNGYGLGGVYDKIFEGNWEAYDPWDASTRVSAVIDNYNGLGACSMFRMFQGWLSMSHTKPFEGTLLVNPLIQLSTAYLLLRPFFRPVHQSGPVSSAQFLSPENWEFAGNDMTSDLQGAWPGHGQELSVALHPHLELDKTMVHMPTVRPGDFVVWHCDSKWFTP